MNILITGGASGLGKTITLELLKDKNNTVFFTYYKSKESATEIEKKNSNAKSIYCNFEDEKAISILINEIELMNLDVLINNAITGINKNHFHKIVAESFTESFIRNILPTIKITQKSITQFRKKKFGKIITILSSAIIDKTPIGWSQYVAEKNYLYSLHKSWAIENINFNITSNCVSPSFMQTALNKDTDERIIEEMIKNHPQKKLLTTEEVANTIVFLCNTSQQINGQNIVINSGSDLI